MTTSPCPARGRPAAEVAASKEPRMAFPSNSSPERATAFAAAFGREPPQLDPSSPEKGGPMSLLKTINPRPLGTPRESKAAPDRLVSGDPSFKTWAQDT